jgi:hypothetical protein
MRNDTQSACSPLSLPDWFTIFLWAQACVRASRDRDMHRGGLESLDHIALQLATRRPSAESLSKSSLSPRYVEILISH